MQAWHFFQPKGGAKMVGQGYPDQKQSWPISTYCHPHIQKKINAHVTVRSVVRDLAYPTICPYFYIFVYNFAFWPLLRLLRAASTSPRLNFGSIHDLHAIWLGGLHTFSGQFFLGGSVNDLHVIWGGLCTICRSFCGFCTTYRSFFEVHLRSTCQLFLGDLSAIYSSFLVRLSTIYGSFLGPSTILEIIGEAVYDLKITFGVYTWSTGYSWRFCLRYTGHFFGTSCDLQVILASLCMIYRSASWSLSAISPKWPVDRRQTPDKLICIA